jgi:hypothetical protein
MRKRVPPSAIELAVCRRAAPENAPLTRPRVRFRQIGGDRSAVDIPKRVLCARAAVVDELRRKLSPRRFPRESDFHRILRHLPVLVFETRSCSNRDEPFSFPPLAVSSQTRCIASSSF